MNAIQETKGERINLVLKAQAKSVIERAAGLEGKNVSSFILTSALEHAEQTITEHEVMKLSADDAEAFAAHDHRVVSE